MIFLPFLHVQNDVILGWVWFSFLKLCHMKKLWFYISFCCNLELLPKVSIAKTQKIMFIGPND